MTHWEPPPPVVVKLSYQPGYHVAANGGREDKTGQEIPTKSFLDLKEARSYSHSLLKLMLTGSELSRKDDDVECLAQLFTVDKDDTKRVLEELFLVIRRSLKGSIR